MLKNYDEKYLEKKLNSEIKRMGGMSIKLSSPFLVGLPDRLCLLPQGRLFFSEIKTPGKKPRRIQWFMIKKIRKLGFHVVVIDSMEILLETIQKYEKK